MLILFVGRSHPYNLYHCMVPFVLTSILILHQAAHGLSKYARLSVVPVVALAIAVGWMVTNPRCQAYRGLARDYLRPEPIPVSGRYLLPDTADVYLAPESAARADEIAGMCTRLKQLSAGGVSVAIFDDCDVLLCLAAHCRPWSRHLSVMSMLHTNDQVAAIMRALRANPPRYVVIRNPDKTQISPNILPHVAKAGALVQDTLRTAVQQLYQRGDTVGPFEIWERKPTGAAHAKGSRRDSES